MSGVWTRQQVSSGAPGVGARVAVKGIPERTAAGHVGGLGAVLGLQAGLRVTQGCVHARQAGFRRGGSWGSRVVAAWEGLVWSTVSGFLSNSSGAARLPRLPRAPTAPRRAPHAAVRERLHRGRVQTHMWVELCGPPSSQTYQDGPGKRFQHAGTHGAGWVWGAEGQGLLQTQTVAPSQLGGDDLPPPGGHPRPLLPLGFLWASKGGARGDAVRSHNLLVF